ncbi:hypothetical protein B0H19DRAFT_1365164, partial [Mycena capillaripes]
MIPPELIDAVVSELDTRSLKAYALTSSSFCGPSKRVLFRSFRLEDVLLSHRYSSCRACTLFSDSQHIATYIQHLEIHLPMSSTPSKEIESLQRVLPKLTHVRHCLISGIYTGALARWSDYPREFSSAVLDLVSGQEFLSSLSVCFMKEIRPPVFLRFLASAPTLSFLCCYLRGELGKFPWSAHHFISRHSPTCLFAKERKASVTCYPVRNLGRTSPTSSTYR